MCELCASNRDTLEKGERGVLLNEKKNKGTQYRFVRDYEREFKLNMAKTLAATTKSVVKRLAEQMSIVNK